MVQFNLQKQEERVKFSLQKRNLNNVKAQIAIVLDISGSMRDLYRRGVVQQALQSTLPIALNMDDNQNLDVYTFCDGNSYYSIPEGATRENYADYVSEKILSDNSVPKWGGTDYSPVLEKVLDDYGYYQKQGGFLGLGAKTALVPNSKSGLPSVVYFYTDGESSDESRVIDLLKRTQSAKSNIYFVFIGIGNERFQFLSQIADKFDNTGFFKIEDLESSTNSDDFHEQLLPDELVSWLKK